MPNAVICKNITKIYGEGTSKVEALRGVDLEVEKGELLMMMGPSGSGKTTLISVIAGILTQTEGECLVSNLDLNHMSDQNKTHYRGKHIGFVFQSFNLIPMLSCEENVAVPLLLNGADRRSALEKARTLLKDVGIPEKIDVSPADISGGQQQRVAIARAMIHDPDLIVCDEPTSYLDHDTGIKVMELLRSIIGQNGKTLIVVTHDVRITKFADRIVRLEDGRIV
ncbi:MAG: ABC transporter ATP-binding protein [Verrucomicrobia bacterium]|nr:ABC transporter ATP-binding protein [Verrucomicrobiota bacterium]